jgi:hypothetical protein
LISAVIDISGMARKTPGDFPLFRQACDHGSGLADNWYGHNEARSIFEEQRVSSAHTEQITAVSAWPEAFPHPEKTNPRFRIPRFSAKLASITE